MFLSIPNDTSRGSSVVFQADLSLDVYLALPKFPNSRTYEPLSVL